MFPGLDPGGKQASTSHLAAAARHSPPLLFPSMDFFFPSAASCSFPSDSGQGQSSTCGSSRASTQVWEGQKHYVHLDA